VVRTVLDLGGAASPDERAEAAAAARQLGDDGVERRVDALSGRAA